MSASTSTTNSIDTSSVSQEVRDQIVTMVAENRTAGKIARELKIKKALVEAIIAEEVVTTTETGTLLLGDVATDLPLTETGTLLLGDVATDLPLTETVVDTVKPTAQEERDAKLQALLGAAKVQADVIVAAQSTTPRATSTRQTVTLIKVPVTSSKDENGMNVQRRNLNCPTRQIAVFTSAKLNACFISTNLAYCTKTNAGAIAHAKRDLKPQKMIQPLLAADDLVMTLEEQHIDIGDSLNSAKANVFDLYKSQGFDMLCVRPKTATMPAPVVTTVDNTDALADAVGAL